MPTMTTTTSRPLLLTFTTECDYLWNTSFSRSCLVVNVFQAKCEEDPTKNLLGVVGTDVRVNDLVKLIPTYKARAV